MELKNLLKKGIILNIFFGVLMFVLAQVSAPLISQVYVGYDETVYRLSVHALILFVICAVIGITKVYISKKGDAYRNE